MQNTSRIQTHPNTLIKDFFIAGLTQETLVDRVCRTYKEQVNITPEMLFSMFKTDQDVLDHLKFVFPYKIAIERQGCAVAPKFFTFVSTDDQGQIAFYHSLVFFEQFTKRQILANFVPSTVELKKREKQIKKFQVREAANSQFVQKRTSSSIQTNNSEDDVEMEFDMKPDEYFMQSQMRAHAKRNNVTPCLKASQMGKTYEPNQPTLNFSSDFAFRRDSNKAGAGGTISGNLNDIVKAMTWKEQEPKPDEAAGKKSFASQKRGIPQIKKTISAVANKGSDNVLASVIHETDEEHSEMQESFRVGDSQRSQSQHEQQIPILDQIKNFQLKSKDASVEESEESEPYNPEEQEHSSSDPYQSVGEDDVALFAPIAFVISTDIENHDIFREVLIELFESIRKPGQAFADFQSNRKLAFADFVAHIAFLKTIPCPPFQTRYNIEFFGKTLVVEEGAFFQIPNKNQNAIRILFEILDVRTILYCWKALLFDCTLVVISEQQSLQFYVAEGLKQLMFPLTWQNSYIQPANQELLDYAESPSPVLLCTSPLDGNFDYFENLIRESGLHNLAILDVDGCYTNDIQFPKLSEERMKLQTLNKLKNKRISKIDLAFPDHCLVDDSEQVDSFVSDVRQSFFNFLQPYLECVPDFINSSFKGNDVDCIFGNYFKSKEYEKHVGEKEDKAFAQRLVNSSQFIHFCDDFFSEDLSNYKMFFAIVNNGTERDNMNDEQKQEMDDALIDAQRRVSTVLTDDAFESAESLTKHKSFGLDTKSNSEIMRKRQNQKEWPANEPVCIDWRMPSDNQRVMLFERMEYLMMEVRTERLLAEHKGLTQNDKVDFKEFQNSFEKFSALVQKIKTLYPKKLEAYQRQLLIADGKSFQEIASITDVTSQTGGKDVSYDSLKRDVSRGLQRQSTEVLQVWFQDSAQAQRKADEEQGTSNESNSQNDSFSSNAKSGLNNIPAQLKQSCSSAIEALIKKDQDQAAQSKNRIAKLMYGNCGLLQFVRELFELFDKTEKADLNYYFSLRHQINRLEMYPESIDHFLYPDSDHKYKQHYLQEEGGQNIFEQADFNVEKLDQIRSLRNKASTSVKKKFSDRKNNKMLTSQQVQIGQIAVRSTKITNFEANHISESVWFIPKTWQDSFQQLKQTQQFYMLKVKTFTSFETFEQSLNLAFNQMLQFPQKNQNVFPFLRFNYFLQSLTIEQKKNVLTQNQYLDKFQLLYIHQQIQAENFNNEQISLDSSQFQNIDILNPTPYKRPSASKQRPKIKKLQSEKLAHLDQLSASINVKLKKGQSSPVSPKKQTFLQKIFGTTPKVQGADVIKQSSERQKFKPTVVITDLAIGNSLKSDNVSTGRTNSCQLDFSMSKHSLQKMNETISDDFVSINPEWMSSSSFKTEICQDGEVRVTDLLVKVICFWKNSMNLLNMKSGTFRAEDVPKLTEKLCQIKHELLELKKLQFVFTENANVRKQVFWVNLLNFMMLFNLAEICILRPAVVKTLCHYSMWQSMSNYCCVYIHGVKISYYLIYHSILRQNRAQPVMAAAMQAKMEKNQLPPSILDLIVDDPHDFICSALYLPIKNLVSLEVYKVATFNAQLVRVFQENYGSKIQAKFNNFLIRVPRQLQWFLQDFTVCPKGSRRPDLDELLANLIKLKAVAENTDHFAELKRVIQQMKKARESTGVSLHFFDFANFKFVISFQTLKEHILHVQLK